MSHRLPKPRKTTIPTPSRAVTLTSHARTHPKLHPSSPSKPLEFDLGAAYASILRANLEKSTTTTKESLGFHASQGESVDTALLGTSMTLPLVEDIIPPPQVSPLPDHCKLSLPPRSTRFPTIRTVPLITLPRSTPLYPLSPDLHPA